MVNPTSQNMMKRLFSYAGILLCMAVLVVSCSKDDGDGGINWGGGGSGGGSSTYVAGSYTSRLEVPALKAGNIFVQHSSLEGRDSVMTYCLEYDPMKYHSRWVAFRFDSFTRVKNVNRKDYSIRPQYVRDPKLPSYCAVPSDLSFAGYDHGHICASYDRLYSRTANDNTFYMTNMTPQINSFNGTYWAEYENYVQTKGRDASFADTLYVCKGGTIENGQILNMLSLGGGIQMPQPKYYFIALLRVRSNTYSAIGFWIEHKNYGNNVKPSKANMHAAAMCIDDLEERTGIDFFHNLPDVVEANVERLCPYTDWGL